MEIKDLAEFKQTMTSMKLDRIGAVGLFLRERCEIDLPSAVSSAELYRAYLIWCEQQGTSVFSHKTFSVILANYGAISERRTSGRWWLGLRLKEG